MAKKSLNQVLAEQLAAVMAERGLSAAALARKAHVAANTISNYLKAEPASSKSGKERSAKLAEVERIAEALGVHPMALLMSSEEQKERAAAAAALLFGSMPTSQEASNAPNSPSGKRAAAGRT